MTVPLAINYNLVWIAMAIAAIPGTITGFIMLRLR